LEIPHVPRIDTANAKMGFIRQMKESAFSTQLMAAHAQGFNAGPPAIISKDLLVLNNNAHPLTPLNWNSKLNMCTANEGGVCGKVNLDTTNEETSRHPPSPRALLDTRQDNIGKIF